MHLILDIKQTLLFVTRETTSCLRNHVLFIIICFRMILKSSNIYPIIYFLSNLWILAMIIFEKKTWLIEIKPFIHYSDLLNIHIHSQEKYRHYIFKQKNDYFLNADNRIFNKNLLIAHKYQVFLWPSCCSIKKKRFLMKFDKFCASYVIFLIKNYKIKIYAFCWRSLL